MISYRPFYDLLKKKEISTYKLINTYGLSSSLLNRLRHNKPVNTTTINDLCKILNCKVEEVMEYIPDEE